MDKPKLVATVHHAVPKVSVVPGVGQPKPGPAVNSMGYPNDPRSKGVETRGNGAATKGRKAYGPLA